MVVRRHRISIIQQLNGQRHTYCSPITIGKAYFPPQGCCLISYTSRSGGLYYGPCRMRTSNYPESKECWSLPSSNLKSKRTVRSILNSKSPQPNFPLHHFHRTVPLHPITARSSNFLRERHPFQKARSTKIGPELTHLPKLYRTIKTNGRVICECEQYAVEGWVRVLDIIDSATFRQSPPNRTNKQPLATAILLIQCCLSMPAYRQRVLFIAVDPSHGISINAILPKLSMQFDVYFQPSHFHRFSLKCLPHPSDTFIASLSSACQQQYFYIMDEEIEDEYEQAIAKSLSTANNKKAQETRKQKKTPLVEATVRQENFLSHEFFQKKEEEEKRRKMMSITTFPELPQ